MNIEHPRFFLSIASVYVAAIALVLLMASPLLAQRPAPPPGTLGNDVDPAKVRMADETRREMMLREGGKEGPAKPADSRTLEASIKQIKQDFTRIQIVRNELVRAILKQQALDYKFVFDKTREIRKSAGRLKTDLRLYDPNSDGKTERNLVELDQTKLKSELVKLCNTIFSFTENPTMKTPDLVDINTSAKARTDLQTIIDLSEGISKGAEKLTEAPKK